MKWLSHWLFTVFHFNRQERNGVFVLMCLIILLTGLRIAWPYLLSQEEPIRFANVDLSKFKLAETHQRSNASDRPIIEQPGAGKETGESHHEKFVFDPNTVSYNDALKLGFPPKTAHILLNFRQKGGKFRKPEDLAKLYGLPEPVFRELEPYILITDALLKTADSAGRPRFRKFPVREKVVLELNSADSVAIEQLRGIGPALTHRILKYRSMLGGYCSAEQLHEVYGMNDSLVQSLLPFVKVDAALITKIPLNTVDFKTLKKHPYLTFQATQAILNYRAKHGKISPDDLRNLGVLDPVKLQHLMPYLQFDGGH